MIKRLGSTVLVLFGASVLVFVMTINSGDPLADLRESTDPDAEYQMQQRTQSMNLDQPWYIRYWMWLRGVLGCFTLSCNFGTNRDGQNMNAILGQAVQDSLRLVLIATVASIVLGILIGIVSAVRQYSLFDYSVSFTVFLFFSLPIFWAAVLAKEWLAIRYNNWMADPGLSWPMIFGLSAAFALVVTLIMGGDVRRRVVTIAASAIFAFAALTYFDWANFAHEPRLGPILIGVLAVGLAFGLTSLIAGLHNRQVLYTALAVVGLGMVSYYLTWGILQEPAGGWLLILGLFLLTIGVCVLLGRLMGGYAKGQATAVAVLTGILMSGLVLLDHFMYHWPGFLGMKPRPVSTIGSHSRQFTDEGVGFWDVSLDQLTQLWMPTMLLMVVSLATYTRYTRSSMLEVARQDYIRTARAKGANERTVVLKHGFRNAMIPLATIVAFDFAGLIGGTIIVEAIFNWNGMGGLFIQGLRTVDPPAVMGFVMVTGFVAVLFNLLADIMYAVLDPRIRV